MGDLELWFGGLRAGGWGLGLRNLGSGSNTAHVRCRSDMRELLNHVSLSET